MVYISSYRLRRGNTQRSPVPILPTLHNSPNLFCINCFSRMKNPVSHTLYYQLFYGQESGDSDQILEG